MPRTAARIASSKSLSSGNIAVSLSVSSEVGGLDDLVLVSATNGLFISTMSLTLIELAAFPDLVLFKPSGNWLFPIGGTLVMDGSLTNFDEKNGWAAIFNEFPKGI